MLSCLIVSENQEEEVAQVLNKYDSALNGELLAGRKEELVKEREEK